MAGEIPTPEELTQAQTDELHQRLRSDREEIEAPLEASESLKRQIKGLALEANVADLDRRGYTIVENVAPLEFFDRLRERILEIAAEDRARGLQTLGGSEDSPTGQTVFHLLSRGRVFEEAVLNPKLIALLTHLLARSFTVSTLTAMVRGQGTPALGLHSDNQYKPQPFPPYAQGTVAVWCCEDFTAEGGATRLVPGSHRLQRHPKRGEGNDEAIAIECPKGSIAMWGSNVWHGNCARTTHGQRVTLHTAFTRSYMRPMESYDDMPREVIERNPPLFEQLIGRNLPYGFGEEGPDPQAMLRATLLGMS